MAFGLLVNKWRVFKSPLRVRMKNVAKVVHVACILHNYCIDERVRQDEFCDVDDDEDMLKALRNVSWSDDNDEASMSFRSSLNTSYKELYNVSEPLSSTSTKKQKSTQCSKKKKATKFKQKPSRVKEPKILRNGIVQMIDKRNLARPEYNPSDN
ncbi:hypothetical protein DVH05_019640 [Phytophthora capsici]|nr:hypothetical protein DVH05_015303 [Phytophthora capsici]KAG1684455.1 hypothetical protein DVH05_011129 [Phytophthora capsici]KAG1685855.1 hypothetical protein DVH05_007621 [Phytophthora capsici]KAG1695484.1 hypothetical protein DVH05_019640 [Phytophthora capsici]